MGSEKETSNRTKWTEFEEVNDGALIKYFIHGADPSLLVVAGIHGDEHWSIGPATRALKKHGYLLNGFLFVPQASPSAVKARTETNRRGNNVNRQFGQIIKDSEAIALRNVVKHFGPFNTVVSCHEDELLPFYLYHGGKKDHFLHLSSLRDEITALGVNLHSGYDLPKEEDPALGFWFENGYNYTENNGLDTSFESWLVEMGLAKTVYTIETPMELDQSKKDQIYNAFFRHVILPNPALVRKS